MSIRMDIILVGGYRGMGKDYFYQMLSRCNEWNCTYSLWSKNSVDLSFLNKPAKLIKMSTTLKQDVAEILRITVDELESKKDVALDRPYTWKLIRPRFPTYRHVLIDRAEYTRSIDPEYYVKRAAEECEVDKLNVITDWRNLNELNIDKYITSNSRVTTIRIHRDGVPIPSSDLVSEHYITQLPVDLLILPPNRTPSDYSHLFSWTEGFERIRIS